MNRQRSLLACTTAVLWVSALIQPASSQQSSENLTYTPFTS